MKYISLLFLILFALGARAQQRRPALAPLPPRVVALDSGQTLRRALVGIDPTAYQQLRTWQATDRELHRLDSLRLAAASQEMQRLRGELAAAYRALDAQREATAQALARPRQPPMLLDVNYYKGVGSGFLAGLFLGFKYLPKP